MGGHMWDDLCEEINPELAEFAMGVLDGVASAKVVRHLEHCPACAAEAESFADAAGILLDVLPATTPPQGFAERTVARFVETAGAVETAGLAVADRAKTRSLQGPAARRSLATRRSRAIASVAAAIVLLGAGIGLGALLASPAKPIPQGVLTSAVGSTIGISGTVVLAPGGDGWLVMSLDGGPGSATLRCSITLRNGEHRTLGAFPLSDGWASWAARLPVAESTVTSVQIADEHGKTVGWATFS